MMLTVARGLIVGLLLMCIYAYTVPYPRLAVRSAKTIRLSNLEPWKSPNHSVKDLEQWWKENNSLLTIGSAGVTPTHVNSLANLIQQHRLVKVKVATDKIDVNTIAQAVVGCNELASKVVLLEVRSKGFMLGRR